MLLSVVVVNWNSREDLRACLTSLRAQDHRELEVVVVDNGSTDGSVEMVRGDFPEMVLLDEKKNLGFAEGCNRGIAASHGPWVAMLNNDAIAEEGWARALVAAAERCGEDCGMLQSQQLFLDRPAVINSTGIQLSASGGGRDRDEGRARDERSDPESIFCPTAGAAAYRRTMLDAVELETGTFDADHFMYYEDLDLGWRSRLAGWSALYVPTAVVLHKSMGSARRHGRSWLVAIARVNRIRTLLKNASPSMLVRALPMTLTLLPGLAWHGRLGGIASLARAVPHSLRARQRVEAMRRVDRREVERDWIGRR